jgi:hypothetical protein
MQTCSCSCHQTAVNSSDLLSNDEYLRFEQALQQLRQEQQLEKYNTYPITSRLLRAFKDQHDGLMNLYEKHIPTKKIDREQQTSITNDEHDVHMQTDVNLQQSNDLVCS